MKFIRVKKHIINIELFPQNFYKVLYFLIYSGSFRYIIRSFLLGLTYNLNFFLVIGVIVLDSLLTHCTVLLVYLYLKKIISP